LADAGVEPDGSFVGGEQVGLQGCAGDGACGVAGRLSAAAVGDVPAVLFRMAEFFNTPAEPRPA
jgi:hypothetical protein